MLVAPIPLPDPPAATALLREALSCDPTLPLPYPRDAALGAFRRHLTRIQADVRDAFERVELTGIKAARRLAALTDGLLAVLLDYATEREGGADAVGPLTVAATGGFGRSELAPFSDLDLLFLIPEPPRPAALATVEFMLYFLWDLGLKVGHATRSVAECLAEARRDATICTSMLTARRVAGDSGLFVEFDTRFAAQRAADGPAGYLAAKREERDARHRRYGDSPFVVEPNIKESRGGLRDLQTLYWMARYAFGITGIIDLASVSGPAANILTLTEARLALRSWDFLWTLRFHLHYVAGRAEERLTFDLQPVVGARMGYVRHGRQDGVERFMRHYFLTAREVTRLTHVMEPALTRAALGPPAVAAETDRRCSRRGSSLRTASCSPPRGGISATNRSRCCASCRSRATAVSRFTRSRCAR